AARARARRGRRLGGAVARRAAARHAAAAEPTRGATGGERSAAIVACRGEAKLDELWHDQRPSRTATRRASAASWNREPRNTVEGPPLVSSYVRRNTVRSRTILLASSPWATR